LFSCGGGFWRSLGSTRLVCSLFLPTVSFPTPLPTSSAN
jgi:hypothetical protein